MRQWSQRSLEVYETLDPRMQDLADYILHNVADISLICGYRGKKAQNRAYDQGKSQLRFPQSVHNKFPSKALDFQPYPYPGDRAKLWASLAYVAGAAREYAKDMGYDLRWGGDWSQDGDLTDQNFDDLYHLELID